MALYESLKSLIDEKIDACETAEDFNSAKKELDALETIWDSRLYWRDRLFKATQEKGVEFDKKKSFFVTAKTPTTEKTTEAA